MKTSLVASVGTASRGFTAPGSAARLRTAGLYVAFVLGPGYSQCGKKGRIAGGAASALPSAGAALGFSSTLATNYDSSSPRR
jgi:hypothetical protein